jgi:pimeloyl-ACP methyl ester carboxylesterase
VIAAKYDRLTKPEASFTMEKKIPSSQVLLLDPAGHMGLMERHAEVNEGVSRFLTGLKNEG